MSRILRPALAALVLAATGCASSGAVPRPFPGGGYTRPEARTAPAPDPAGVSIAETALEYRGVPYRPGGTDPSGFDCSGLVWYVLYLHGVALPRTVEEQFRIGRSVRNGDVGAGDLVFFRTSGRGPTHVGVAVSREEFVHAPNSRGEVRVDRLASSYWGRRFIAARRLW